MFLFIIDPRRMAEERTRRLPKWLAIDNGKTKKKIPEENRPRKDQEELPTPPRNSVSPANKEKKRKRGNILQRDESSNTGTNVNRGKKRKQNAKNNATPPTQGHTLEEDEDDLTVDDLVSIAREYVKGSEDSEKFLLLSRNGQPSSSNAIDESSEQKISSCETRVFSGSAADLSGEQSFVELRRTDDPALDMLHLYLGPLL